MIGFTGVHFPVDPVEPMRQVTYHDHYEMMRAPDGVGGHFEPIAAMLDDPRLLITMWVNEEAAIFNMPVNMRASAFMKYRILGPAVLTGGANEDGDTLSLPQSLIDKIISLEMEAHL